MSAEQQATAGDTLPGRPARPSDPLPNGVRRDDAYWARIRRIVDQAPPLTDEQRAEIRVAIWGGRPTAAKAAA